jgi:hypothetical protein
MTDEELNAAASALFVKAGNQYQFWYTVDQTERNYYLKLAQDALAGSAGHMQADSVASTAKSRT